MASEAGEYGASTSAAGVAGPAGAVRAADTNFHFAVAYARARRAVDFVDVLQIDLAAGVAAPRLPRPVGCDQRRALPVASSLIRDDSETEERVACRPAIATRTGTGGRNVMIDNVPSAVPHLGQGTRV